jgi:hypothetical protein
VRLPLPGQVLGCGDLSIGLAQHSVRCATRLIHHASDDKGCGLWRRLADVVQVIRLVSEAPVSAAKCRARPETARCTVLAILRPAVILGAHALYFGVGPVQ